MEKNKLNWCIKEKRGIELINPKDHLSKSYLKEADETLIEMLKLEGKWKVITAYYACYNSVYAILMKCGIKSEIHTCTIELMRLLPFEKEDIEFLTKLKNNRIQAQYYLKEKILNNENKVKIFISKSKLILNQLNENKIEEIRKKLK